MALITDDEKIKFRDDIQNIISLITKNYTKDADAEWLKEMIERYHHPDKYKTPEQIAEENKSTFEQLLDEFLSKYKASEVRKICGVCDATLWYWNKKGYLKNIKVGNKVRYRMFNIHQANRNSDLRDNDIKYRYVKMQGEASAADVYRLESIFEYDRNADSMKIIRRQVEDFERLLKEYNEKQYRIRQNEARACEIEQEAATVKGNK